MHEGGVDDPWVIMAMDDDFLVAYTLLELQHRPVFSFPELRWTVRQPRSQWYTRTGKKPFSARSSPTTPLSWTAATSGHDANQDSSRPTRLLHASRSDKVGDPTETETATSKKRKRKGSIRKKSLTRLKEEEKSLLREKNNLIDELTSRQRYLEKVRARNETLKRIKLELESEKSIDKATTSLVVSEKAVPEKPDLVEGHCPPSSNLVSQQLVEEKDDLVDQPLVSEADSSNEQHETRNEEPPFVMPDLNLPAEQDLNSDEVLE